jgi:hypothetical protein
VSESGSVFLSCTMHGLPDNEWGPPGLSAALEAAGFEVFFYPDTLRPGDGITDEVVAALERAHVVLCWVTPEYLTRRACREELTLSLLAEERELVGSLGGPRSKRVLGYLDGVDAGAVPARMSELVLADAERHGFDDVVAMVSRAMASVPKDAGTPRPLGRISPVVAIEGVGADGFRDGLPRFVGRLHELFELRDHLHFSRGQVGPSAADRSAVIVAGMGGAGKSLLASVYANTFAAAYPGGWFWSSAGGNGDGTGAGLDEGARLRMRRDNWWAKGVALLGTEALDPTWDEAALRSTVSRALGQRTGEVLWVVDDLASGVTGTEADGWRPEGVKNVFVLYTARQSPGGGLAELDLGDLDEPAAVQLLLAGIESPTKSQVEVARRIVAALGRHALAVDLARGLRVNEGLDAVERLVTTDLERFDDLVATTRAVGNLPGDHASAITATLAASVRRLPAEAQWLLAMAAEVGDMPIPRGLVDELAAAAAATAASASFDPAVAFSAAISDGCALQIELPRSGPALRVHVLVSAVARGLVQLQGAEAAWVAALTSRLSSAGHNAAEHMKLAADCDLAARLARSEAGAHAATLSGHVTAPPNGDGTAPSDLRAWLAISRYNTGDANAAADLERQVLADRVELLGERHPATLTAKANLASSLRALGDANAAADLERQVLADRVELLGERHPRHP